MQTEVSRIVAHAYPHAFPSEWHSVSWLNRQADLQLSLGRHVAAERLAERAAELVEAHS